MFGERASHFIGKSASDYFNGEGNQTELERLGVGLTVTPNTPALRNSNPYSNNITTNSSVNGVFEDGEQRGIVPRALEHMFQIADQDSEHNYQFAISYVQIYCEIISDLLIPENTNLSIREDYRATGGNANPRGVYIEGSASFSISSQQQAMEIIRSGDENRHIASTKMNATSSRSHACIIVTVEKRNKIGHDVDPTNTQSQPSLLFGKLILVDLAGSERVKKALDGKHPNGTRFAESKAINLSLSALGNCISALATKKKHVPYRDAKLTRLLQDSLGGNCKTSLILNVGPCDIHESETYSSLLFGQRAMAVETRVHLNEEIDYKVLYTRVQKVLDRKDDEIHGWEIKFEQSQRALVKAQILQAQAEKERDRYKERAGSTKESMEVELNALRAILDENKILVREVGESGDDETKVNDSTALNGTQTRIIAGKMVTTTEQNGKMVRTTKQNTQVGVDGVENTSETALASLKNQWKRELEIAAAAHAKAVETAKHQAAIEIRRLTEQCQTSSEEWNRLESELKAEKEEHLDTCQLLHVKQKKLAELEMSTGGRVAELLEECNDRNDQIKTLEMKLEASFKDRKKLASASEDEQVAVVRLKNELQKSHEYQARTLKLMDTLTARVEHLEEQRVETASLSSARSYRSTGRQEYITPGHINRRVNKLSTHGTFGGVGSVPRRGGHVNGNMHGREEVQVSTPKPQQEGILKSAVQRSRNSRTTAASILGDFGQPLLGTAASGRGGAVGTGAMIGAGIDRAANRASVGERLQALRDANDSSRWR